MKNVRTAVWGLVVLAVGVIFALNALGITEVDIFFKGWWTLLIIIPCGVGLITGRDRSGNLIGLLIGAFLLLCMYFENMWKLVVPAIIIAIGLKMILRGVFGSKTEKVMHQIEFTGETGHNSFTAFSGSHVNLDGQTFRGAEIHAVFGGLEYDLRGAVILNDCVIKATAIFGGIDILLPQDVNVKVVSNSIFGGVDNKRGSGNLIYPATVYIEGSGIFGGVDIK